MQKINFRKADLTDLQLLRYWRNKTHVIKELISQHTISFDHQINWHKNNQHLFERFFIYSDENIDVGVVHSKVVDEANGEFEAGIFCGNADYLGSAINVGAIVGLYNEIFFQENMKICRAVIKNDNATAVRFNKMLGFQENEKIDEEFTSYSLSKHDYKKSSARFMHRFQLNW